MTTRRILLEVISSLMILLFLYACMCRWLDFQQFKGEMNNQPISNTLTPWLIWIIPGTEALISVLLIFKRTRLTGFWISVGLMSVFTAYTSVILMHGFAYQPCTCGGIIRNLTWLQNLELNLFLLILPIIGIFMLKRERKLLTRVAVSNKV